MGGNPHEVPTTTVNSNTVNIKMNIIILNSDETCHPSQNAGFEIERDPEMFLSSRMSINRRTTMGKDLIANSFAGSLSGNASTATTLETNAINWRCKF